jgi:hypothetical protein
MKQNIFFSHGSDCVSFDIDINFRLNVGDVLGVGEADISNHNIWSGAKYFNEGDIMESEAFHNKLYEMAEYLTVDSIHIYGDMLSYSCKKITNAQSHEQLLNNLLNDYLFKGGKKNKLTCSNDVGHYVAEWLKK